MLHRFDERQLALTGNLQEVTVVGLSQGCGYRAQNCGVERCCECNGSAELSILLSALNDFL